MSLYLFNSQDLIISSWSLHLSELNQLSLHVFFKLASNISLHEENWLWLALASICQAFLVLLCRSLPIIVLISITTTVCTFVWKGGGICIYFFLSFLSGPKGTSFIVWITLDIILVWLSDYDFCMTLFLFISYKELAGKYSIGVLSAPTRILNQLTSSHPCYNERIKMLLPVGDTRFLISE